MDMEEVDTTEISYFLESQLAKIKFGWDGKVDSIGK